MEAVTFYFRPIATRVALLAVALVTGFALFAFDTPLRMPYILTAAAAAVALLLYPEVALALYVVVGDVKGDDHISTLFPVDLTLALGAILVAGIVLNLLRKKRMVPMPPAYFLFLVLVALMAASLAYTPVLDAGLEKLVRFLTVTGIVIDRKSVV